MRWGHSLLATGVSLLIFVAASAQNSTLVQQTSNNTSACSSSTDPGGNHPYCFNSFDGFATNPNNMGTETLVPDSPAGHVSSLGIKQLMYPGWSGRVICEYQPWFGAGNHKTIGYNQNNAATAAAQDSFMLAVGCDINLIDFYGSLDPNQAFNLASTNAIFSDLSARAGHPLKFGIMEDKNALTYSCSPSSTNESATLACVQTALVADMDYVNTHYAQNGAYFTDGGNPVVFSFITPSTWPILTSSDWNTIWSAVKAHTDAYAAGFKYIHEFGAFTSTPWDNGRYAWMQPPQYTSSQQYWWGSVTSLSPTYLDNFYTAGIAHPSQITVGGLWKGFDDNNASWSGNRIIAEQCGQVWLDSANEISKFFGGVNPQIPYVQIATWNDYEEGTEIETGIDNCYTVNASIAGTQLNWSLTASDSYANPATVHHFNVYYVDSGGYLYTAASNLSTATNTANLSSIVPPGTWTVYVEMVGQPLIINRMSSGVTFNNGNGAGQLSSSSLKFSPQTVATTSSGQQVALTNAGSTPMQIYGISVAGDFTQSNNCPSSLAPAASCNISVSFSPTTGGVRTGSLHVSASTGSVAQVASLSGTGVLPAVSFSPATLSFAAQPLSSPSSAQTVALSNTGPGLLVISSVAASGDFSVSNNSCSGTIAASASCSFSVTFTPSAAVARTGSILVTSNALGTNSLTVSGSGADFAINSAPSSASVAAGGSATYIISVPSSGAPFSSAISLSCGGLPASAVCAFSPLSVNAGTISTLTVRTKAAQNAALGSRGTSSGYHYAIWLWSSTFGLLGCMFVSDRSKRKKVSAGTKLTLRVLLLSSLISLCACGGAAGGRTNNFIPGTPAGMYSVTVTGLSGTLAHTAVLTLTVQ